MGNPSEDVRDHAKEQATGEWVQQGLQDWLETVFGSDNVEQVGAIFGVTAEDGTPLSVSINVTP
jgi:hypothetical protein